jgi:hypothetical protein
MISTRKVGGGLFPKSKLRSVKLAGTKATGGASGGTAAFWAFKNMRLHAGPAVRGEGGFPPKPVSLLKKSQNRRKAAPSG